MSRAVAACPAPTPVLVGLRFAFLGGRGARSTPVRTAAASVTVAVAGVIAASLLSASIHHAVNDPRAYGADWDALMVGDGSEHIFDGQVDAERLAGITTLDAAAEWFFGIEITVNGTPQRAQMLRDLRGDTEFVMLQGRTPTGVDDVALASATMRQLGVGVGSRVQVAFGDVTRTMTVSGTAVLTVGGFGRGDVTGAALSGAGASALGFEGSCDSGDVSCSRTFVFTAPAGVDIDAAAQPAVARGAELNAVPPDPPPSVDRLTAVSSVPAAAAILLATIGLVTLSYSAVATVRRRRPDLAVCKELGFSPGGLRATLAVQLGALTFVGVCAGIVAGLVIANLSWDAIAGAIPIVLIVDRPVWALAGIPVAAVVGGLALAINPGRRASRVDVSSVLRDE